MMALRIARFFDRELSRSFLNKKRPLTTCSCLLEKMDQEKYMKNTLVKQERDTQLASKELFQDAKAKNKETFKGALDIFKNRDVRRRGAVEFIEAARKHMKEFGVEKDLEVYKSLMDIMPKGIYVPENRIQSGFFHYPKQQECLVDVLVQMSENGVTPDRETGDLIMSITGLDSAPMRKFGRMRYWHSKFKNLSPFPLPMEMPNDGLELAKLAIERITSVDRTTKISVYDTEFDLPQDQGDKTWIVSGISPFQKEFLSKLPKKSNLYVEVKKVGIHFFENIAFGKKMSVAVYPELPFFKAKLDPEDPNILVMISKILAKLKSGLMER